MLRAFLKYRMLEIPPLIPAISPEISVSKEVTGMIPSTDLTSSLLIKMSIVEPTMLMMILFHFCRRTPAFLYIIIFPDSS